MKKSKKVILIYGTGGHYEQMNRFIEGAKKKTDKYEFISICVKSLQAPLTPVYYYARSPFKPEKHSFVKSFLGLPLFFVSLLRTSLQIVVNHKFSYVVSTGPGLSILYCLFFKLLGKKIVHLETWSRFKTKSNTGRWMYYIADHFFVQNKSLKKIYPKSIYAGRL